MERKFGRVPAFLLTAALSAAAYFLRLRQLAVSYDAAGRAMAGAGNCFFTYFTIAAVLAFGVYAFFLERREKFAGLCGQGAILAAVECLGAAGVALGSGLAFLRPLREGDSALAVAGMVTALCWVASALYRTSGRGTHWALQLLPVVFFGAKLIMNFRVWTRDPAILDYCYHLFALICTMCAALQTAGFRFDKGQRRLTVFFCQAGIFFQAAALAGASKRDAAFTLGVLLWLAAQLWVLLRTEKTPAEA